MCNANPMRRESDVTNGAELKLNQRPFAVILKVQNFLIKLLGCKSLQKIPQKLKNCSAEATAFSQA